MSIENRLTTIVNTCKRYETEGAAFGKLLGSGFTFPKRPECWTKVELNLLANMQRVSVSPSLRDEMDAQWERILQARRLVLGEDYPLRQHPWRAVPEAVKAEFLADEPEVARLALASAIDWNHPGLVVAGHDLTCALERVMDVSMAPRGQLRRYSVINGPVNLESLDGLLPGEAFMWPLEVRVIRHSQSQYVLLPGALSPLCGELIHDGILLRGEKGRSELITFLQALIAFYRQSLLARITIGITMPNHRLSLDSMPLEGILVGENDRLLHLDEDEPDRLACSLIAYAPDARVELPAEEAGREWLIEAVLARWTDTLQVFPLSFEDHLRYVRPLVNEEPSLSPHETEALLAMAASTYPVIAKHVHKVEGGRYRVTRHDIVRPFPMVETHDVVFAIALALAHEVEHPFSLSLGLRAGTA